VLYWAVVIASRLPEGGWATGCGLWRPEASRSGLWIYLHALFFTLQLFPGEMPAERVPDGDYVLAVAQVLAPVATAGAILRIAAEIFLGRIERWRIRAMKDHTIICGLTRHGLAFALSERAASRPVLAVDPDPSEAHATLCRLHGIRLLKGQPRDRNTLRRAALMRAARLIVATSDDTANLEIATRARSLAAERPPGAAPLIVNAAIAGDELWRHVAGSDSIERRGRGFELRPFGLESASPKAVLLGQLDLRGGRPARAGPHPRGIRGFRLLRGGPPAAASSLLRLQGLPAPGRDGALG